MTPLDVVQLVLRILLAGVFAFMGVNHFLPKTRRGMRAMIPPALRRPGIPSPAFLVAFTGVCELAGAAGLVFPANAFAAAHREKFGAVAIPFWPRLIAQLVLIALVLFATLPLR
jgi:uncharacterized membrane protein